MRKYATIKTMFSRTGLLIRLNLSYLSHTITKHLLTSYIELYSDFDGGEVWRKQRLSGVRFTRWFL